MIFISQENNPISVKIPINLARNKSNIYDFILFNTTTRQEYVYNVEDKQEYLQYYSFEVNLDIPDGEYEYKLKDDDNVYSSGLVRIGDYTPERIEYENEIKYKYQRDI